MARIGWKHVTSSNLDEVDYDSQTETLWVRFKDGSVYQYFFVRKYLYHGLINADSKGRFFHANIRNQFNTIKEDADSVTNS